MKLLAIAGKAGTGKDTLAGYLKELGWVSMAFADPLYDALQAMFGITREQMQDRAFKERVIPWIGTSPRELLQTLGTEWGRERVGNELWVKHLARRVESKASPVPCGTNPLGIVPVGIVITDVRMENEAEWVRRHGGTVLHLTRPAPGEVRSHSSEAGVAWKVGDLVYHNRGTIHQLGVMAVLASEVAGEYRDQKSELRECEEAFVAPLIGAMRDLLDTVPKKSPPNSGVYQTPVWDVPRNFHSPISLDVSKAWFDAVSPAAQERWTGSVGVDPAAPGADKTVASSASGLSLVMNQAVNAADELAGIPKQDGSSRINGTSSVPPFPVLFSAQDHLRSTRKPRELRRREILGGWCNAECKECSLVRCEHNPSFRGAK